MPTTVNTQDIKRLKALLPSSHNWKTSDEDEINKRRFRARTESFSITNKDTSHSIFSNFCVKSTSGMSYWVEVRDLDQKHVACDCMDFRSNGLGTCKHVEAVLLFLEARYKHLFRKAKGLGSNRIDIVPDRVSGGLKIERGQEKLPRSLKFLFENGSQSVETVLQSLQKSRIPALRVSQEVDPWLEAQHHAEECKHLRHEYEQKVHSGEWLLQETKVPLYPYQREGMLHLAFKERAMLADEMGLGKTIQAIAACALLHRLGKVSRVLVVTPASLKGEWEEQIQRFTDLPYQLVFGPQNKRLQAYTNAPFFTIVNYEQMVRDSLNVNLHLKPDAVILDEAQRIKNWNTQTAQSIKRLRSRYAFVLTGTPIENRIDEIHSLMDFLDSSALGPLFRFNREFYELDENGRPMGFKNLQKLHEKIKPYMLRRRKSDVETELPERTDKTFFVPMSKGQQATYADHETVAAKLLHAAKRRPLTQKEHEILMIEMAMMRMVCDTNFILDPKDRICPKLTELEKIIEECCEDTDTKILIFSEWEKMLSLVRGLCDKMGLGYAWHTGSVPQKKRRTEIHLFKNDPQCRLFLSTDSGSTGLNLQSASVVINCDLPWNPAKLEQRIARAWRKHQTRPVTVINLVSENTIEHRMLETLASKQALADGVLDLQGDLSQIKFGSGKQSFLKRLEQIISNKTVAPQERSVDKPLPSDRAMAFSQRSLEMVNGRLVRCEERYPDNAPHSVLLVVVERDAPLWMQKLIPIHQELFGTKHSDPSAPVMLEVIDRATDEALRRLEKAGLVLSTTRGSRPLFPQESQTASVIPLTDEELHKSRSHRAVAARKFKMAQLLGDGEMIEEACESLMGATLFLGRAFAVENRIPEPSELKEVLTRPGSCGWKENFPIIQQFAANPGLNWKMTTDILGRLL